MKEIAPKLFVGTREDAAALADRVPHAWEVICVTEYRAQYGRREECPNEPAGALDMAFMHLRTYHERHQQLDAISNQISLALASGRNVLVHCVMAMERSPLAIVWHLVRVGRAPSLRLAYDYMCSVHPRTQRRLGWVGVLATESLGLHPEHFWIARRPR